LTLPDFSLPFVVETDACAVGVGAMLMQQERPVAYLSKALGPNHQSFLSMKKNF